MKPSSTRKQPGRIARGLICAEGRYVVEGNEASGMEKRAAIFIGPEFGTVSRPDLVSAAREAGDRGFDVLITCAFNCDTTSTGNKVGTSKLSGKNLILLDLGLHP